MSKNKPNLNTVYVPERLKEEICNISNCPLTTVVAPMGYGKTTLVNWYLGECSKKDNSLVIRINIYSENLAIFWKSAQDAFSFAGLTFLSEYACPTDAISGGLVTDAICNTLSGKRPVYIFIDDFHLLTDETASTFLCAFARRIPDNMHLVIAGRDSFMHSSDVIGLGNKLYQIDTEQLRLTFDEIVQYTHKCGIEMTPEELQQLFYVSEGWYSAVYLNLNTFSRQGHLPSSDSDIYTMFTEAMIDSLPDDQREFLAVMGLADEFNLPMASFITENSDVRNILNHFTKHNAFVKKLSDGHTYRFHHMMKECAEKTFSTLDREKRAKYINRYGAWYEAHDQYIHAMIAYRYDDNYSKILQVIEKDAGVLLSYIKPQNVLNSLENCPEKVLKAHPAALLVLMRCMFNWHNIPKMLELKELLLESIKEHTEISEEEKGNLLGESDLVTSFLMYNDISAMSKLHQSASHQMTRPAISISNTAGWTFGSPSVLMMFYRQSGDLEKELKEMDECMPHYYKVTDNHGWGAEAVMRAEASFAQGKLSDTRIELEQAYAQLKVFPQENILLCCDFLSQRLSLITDTVIKVSLEERYKELVDHHNSGFINIRSSISAYFYALSGEVEKIPPIFAAHKTETMNVLAPGKPMVDMIENQVYLAQKDYAKVLGKRPIILGMCDALHYQLVKLHAIIQSAAAYHMLDKHDQGIQLLKEAFEIAAPDSLIIPFVECYSYIKDILSDDTFSQEYGSLVAKINKLGKNRDSSTTVMSLHELTSRENEIAALMAKRLSNREIAERLFLSEGSVKQYSNQIYYKLHIEGDTRTKRKRLLEMLAGK